VGAAPRGPILRINEPKKTDARSAATHWYYRITLLQQLNENVIVCIVKNEKKRLGAVLENLNGL
jgi:hypothetical protein